MLKKRLTMVVLLVVMITPALADDNGRLPSGKWWRDPNLADKLQLKEVDRNRLDKLFHENRMTLIDLMRNVEKEQLQLSFLLEKKELDEKAVLAQFDKLETARASLSKERLIFLLQVRKILGAERFQQLKTSYKNMRTMIFKQRGKTVINRKKKKDVPGPPSK